MRHLVRARSGWRAQAGRSPCTPRTPRSALVALAVLAAAALVLAGCGPVGGSGRTDEPTIEPLATLEFVPGDPTEEPTPEATPSRLVELRKAVASGEVAVKGFGVGLESVEIEITDRTDEALRVVVQPGTLFDAGRSKVQAMVVTSKEVIGVGPGETVRTTLDAACSEMELDQPGETDRFRLATRSIPANPSTARSLRRSAGSGSSRCGRSPTTRSATATSGSGHSGSGAGPTPRRSRRSAGCSRMPASTPSATGRRGDGVTRRA
jgi:hypothetical protein